MLELLNIIFDGTYATLQFPFIPPLFTEFRSEPLFFFGSISKLGVIPVLFGSGLSGFV